jgi:superfamily II DNA helicase RecQ
MAKQSIFEVGENFRNQLRSIFADSMELPEEDEHVRERSRKASGWFQSKFDEIFESSVLSLQFETDNKELRKKLNNVLNNTRKEIFIKKAGVRSCADGFSVSAYLRALTVAEIDFQPAKLKKQKAPVYTEEDIAHPVLFESLRGWRTEKAAERSVGAFLIMHQRVLIHIVMQLPQSVQELKKIPGVGKKTIENYGKDILEIVADYLEDTREK